MSNLAPDPRIRELQALLDAAADAVIIIDHQGRIEEFNRSAEQLFGYALAEVRGRNVALLMTDEDRAHHGASLARYLGGGAPRMIGQRRPVTARRKDGSAFPALLSVGRIEGAGQPRFLGFLHDTTVREQAFAAAQHERDRANQFLEAAQTILVALDPEHRVTLINRKGCEVLGCTEQTLLGADWFETVVSPEQAGAAAIEFDTLAEREPHQPHYCEYRVRVAGGVERLIAWRCMVLEDAGGGVTGVLCSGDDVTDARQAEIEAREARERMMHVSRLATMGEMASGISHELNQPLAAINNFAQAAVRLLALPQPELPDVREALEQISAQALRAGEIIRRLRSLVRHRPTERELVDINELVTEIGPLTRADARASDVRVTLQLAAAPQLAEVDRVQIQQVVLILLRNALDALESVAPEHRQVQIETGRSTEGDIRIRVIDSGPGVLPEMLERLFTPFATTKHEGTGLGLAISRSIVEAHRGRLAHVPNQPRGAIFTVTLPAADPRAR